MKQFLKNRFMTAFGKIGKNYEVVSDKQFKKLFLNTQEQQIKKLNKPQAILQKVLI